MNEFKRSQLHRFTHYFSLNLANAQHRAAAQKLHENLLARSDDKWEGTALNGSAVDDARKLKLPEQGSLTFTYAVRGTLGDNKTK